MRLPFFFSLAFAALLTSCANEGVIVKKNSTELPFYETLGVDGSYKLALRDNAGTVRSQLVTPEVFENYNRGEYFNDLQPGAAQSSDPKDIAAMQANSNAQQRVALARRPASSQRIAAVASARPRISSPAAAPQSLRFQDVAKRQSATPVRVVAKGQTPVLAHAAVQAPQKLSSPQRLVSNHGKSSPAHSLASKGPAVSSVKSIATNSPKSVPINSVATKMKSSVTHQVASTGQKISPKVRAGSNPKRVSSLAVVATGTSVPQTPRAASITKSSPIHSTLSSAPKTAVQRSVVVARSAGASHSLAANNHSTQKKTAKRTGLQNQSRKSVSSDKPVHKMRRTAQVALVSAVR